MHGLGAIIAVVFSCFVYGHGLTNAEIQEIQTILSTPRDLYLDLESLEKRYQTLVSDVILEDLLAVYDPKNAPLLNMTYASFTPEGIAAGRDGGFGLHIVKKLTVPQPGGREKVIEVNELWPENRSDHGLFLPDEVRVKTLFFDGPRHVKGSAALYLFQSFRVAWNDNLDSALYYRTRYDYFSGHSSVKVSRGAGASAPFSCRGCHRSTGLTFAGPFLQPGEERDFESHVQKSHYEIPLQETNGFREYLNYLQEQQLPVEFINRAQTALLDIQNTSFLPGFYDTILRTKSAGEVNWLGQDMEIWELGIYPLELQQGVYRTLTGKLYREAIEGAFGGKYHWWAPKTFIPRY